MSSLVLRNAYWNKSEYIYILYILYILLYSRNNVEPLFAIRLLNRIWHLLLVFIKRTGFVVFIIFNGPGHPLGSMAVLCMSSTISVMATLSTDRMAYALAMPTNPMTAITYLLEKAPTLEKYKFHISTRFHVVIIIPRFNRSTGGDVISKLRTECKTIYSYLNDTNASSSLIVRNLPGCGAPYIV